LLFLQEKIYNMKIRLILQFLFLTDGGLFRKSYFFQMIGLYIGTLIISLTFSIMEGMENQIFNKFESFNYKYSIADNISNYYNGPVDNIGKKSLVRLGYQGNNLLVNVMTYDNFDYYVNEKISKSLLYDDILYDDSSIIIGESLSKLHNISMGDTLILSDIINANIVTGSYASKAFIVSNIFKFKFLNFDYENIFIKEAHGTLLKSEDYIYYFKDDHNLKNIYNNENIQNSKNKYATLLSSIEFEKYIYILLGILTIIISSIMIFNNTLLVLLEKRKQFKLLSSLGLNLKDMLLVVFSSNLILSTSLSILALITTLFIERLNIRFNIVDYLFIYSPFDTIPMNLSIYQFIITLLLVIILTAISTILSINNMKYRLKG
tara:strand:+ start:1330 stop:2460 length:1131 start_codon:yes stop_codon:yes gene_type:complete